MRRLIPIPIPYGSEWRVPTVLEDGDGFVLVDCPDPGTFPVLRAALDGYGLELSALKGVVITHHDYDHIGVLAQVLDCCPRARVYASQVEIPYLTGKKPPLRLPSCVHDETEAQRQFRAMITGIRPIRAEAVTEVAGGDRFPWCGGAEVVETPGHVPGHLSLYLSKEKTLLAGDALCAADGVLCAPDARYTLDMQTALASLRPLLHYDIQRVICYHGGVVEGDIRQALSRIAGDSGISRTLPETKG